jgi:hypothetical protein
MTVNHEVKGNLARLLATEDLVVEHKKVQTACFNVHTRVLTLPMWEKASAEVYDMLVGHEVGHALYTPDDDWWDTCKTPKQFVNVVEDVRVEKLMKRRYDGLRKTFYKGYSELSDQDFFSVENENVDEFNLADKVNLYYKIGSFIKINFNNEEREIVDIIGQTETFADVLVAAEILYKFCKQKNDELQKVESLNSHDQTTQQSQSSQNGNQSENQEYVENSSETQSGSKNQSVENKETQENLDNSQTEIDNNTQNVGGNSADIDVKTMSSLEDAIKELIGNNSFYGENVYLEVPELDLDTVIIPNNEIHEECETSWKNTLMNEDKSVFSHIDKKYIEFKRSAQKEVNYLVKEFECRKAADSYSRASTSTTGILDCTKLHTYKYNEDLFKKVTTLSDGKNHGLIFILDWSGSMSEVMMDTIKQLYNLIWFCKKVSIPFEVYAFTYDWKRVKYTDDGKAIMPKPHYERKDGLLHVDDEFVLMNIFTSKISASKLDVQLKNIFRVVNCFARNNYYTCKYQFPYKLSLSGTPLNQSLIALHKILPKFKKENKLQKVQCVILTDGEAEMMKRNVEIRKNTQVYMGFNSISGDNMFLRDRKTGTVYKVPSHYGMGVDLTQILLRNLRDKFVDINFIGMRILMPRDASPFIRSYTGYMENDTYSKLMSSWKKNKSFSIKTSSYHAYFGISSTALNNTTEFVVTEDATKVQIKSAFVKSLASKKMNKKILSEFVDLVA